MAKEAEVPPTEGSEWGLAELVWGQVMAEGELMWAAAQSWDWVPARGAAALPWDWSAAWEWESV
jgi:hypothetical protein